MNKKFRVRQYYQEMLEHLKIYFPAPVSNPIMDGYFAHTISNFLDRVDRLKSVKPLLEIRQEKSYEPNLSQHFPTEMKSVETVTQLLVDYCQGMIVWAHPNAQVNVVSSPTIPSIPPQQFIILTLSRGKPRLGLLMRKLMLLPCCAI